MIEKTTRTSPISPKNLFEINALFYTADSWRSLMNDLIKMLRKHFIFDNLVVYLTDPMTMNLDVAYAKATGRGKSAEADVAWGELLANRVLEEKSTILQDPEQNDEKDRLGHPYSIGLPIQTSRGILGALILIRFGGPEYSPDDKALIEFICQLLSQQIYKEKIRQERDNLEFQFRTFQMQEDFISTVSHELRNPLGFIKGYTTTLLRNDAKWPVETQHEFLTIIDQETDHLQDLIANLSIRPNCSPAKS